MCTLVENSRAHGTITGNWDKSSIMLVFAVALLPVSEIIRACMPGQSVLISALPFLYLTFIWIAYLKAHIPVCLLRSLIPIVILCVAGTVKALLNSIPVISIVMSLTSELVWFTPAFVFYYCARIQSVRHAVPLVFSILVLLSLSFTLYNVCSGNELWNIPLIQGAAVGRSYGDEMVSYYSGTFRTAPSYCSFIVFSSVPIFIAWCSVDKHQYSRTAKAILFIAMASLLPQAILAGRRSQICMLGGAICGLFTALPIAVRRAVGICVAIFLFLILSFFSSALVREGRMAHVTSYLWRDFKDRATVNVITHRDVEVMTLFGHGMGSAGYAALNSPNAGYRAKADDIRTEYPAMHYGWFQCIYAYGWVGIIMKLICFGNIFFLLVRQSALHSKAAKIGLFLLILCMYVYFFIQTSFLESITGGVLFGIAIGYSLSISNMEAISNVGSTRTHTLHQSFARPSYYLKD